jgi:UDP-N-acetylglucosamine transferase subunit ALG13
LILCVLGTHGQPFDRAVDWAHAAAGERPLVVQHGSTPPRPKESNTTWHELIPYDALVEQMTRADLVICHAGVGTLMTAIDLGSKPLAIARLAQYGEHVDDHQLQIARAFRDAGYVIACESEADTVAAAAVPSSPVARFPGDGDLRRAAILAAGGTP